MSLDQNEVSEWIIKEDIGGLVIDLINMLMNMLIRKWSGIINLLNNSKCGI